MRMTGPDSGRLTQPSPAQGESQWQSGKGTTQMTSWLSTHQIGDRTGILQCRHSSKEFLGKERLAISRFLLVGASTRVVPMWGLCLLLYFSLVLTPKTVTELRLSIPYQPYRSIPYGKQHPQR
ncbi:uncharacterized protein BO87DRAFT_377284 [Aspergillus neoniger CBS 115656]|uniref:Uncharacterized protein n=1 Tax=Aspergillus neoniger (strain CBS 115656) TaxID=1448310 RepID=A0A318YGI9_ASPNB|nr:hypothetical protein BO87DRAFT_377284 [Aspergillus neoniger CBS 115656]PYH33575.1 hypothetical protein BO87DRAFT_377284 [Aspergillus neoniger CBS 115656]